MLMSWLVTHLTLVQLLLTYHLTLRMRLGKVVSGLGGGAAHILLESVGFVSRRGVVSVARSMRDGVAAGWV